MVMYFLHSCEGIETMALARETNVIALQAHYKWNALRRRERELGEAMRRHPSSWPIGVVATDRAR